MSSIAYRWNSTAEERAAPYPCDGLVTQPDEALFRALDVEAPARVVFRWLCQLRAAPYSYDWIDNGGRPSPRVLVEGLDQLQRGQTVMSIFDLVDFTPDRHLTLVMKPRAARLFGAIAGTYQVSAIGADR